MLTFNDLVFHPHQSLHQDKNAVTAFENGYGISVVTGEYAYTSEDKPYEVAVLHGDDICYSTPITDDVIGYNTADDVTNIMKQIQELPPNPNCTHDRSE